MNKRRAFSLDNIDYYSLSMDILQNLWVVFLGALTVAMAFFVYQSAKHVNKYTSTTTFAIMSRKSSDFVTNNLSAAQSAAKTFSGILGSDVLKAHVCTNLGIDSFDAAVKTNMVRETNIMLMSVTADSPQMAYNISRAIIDEYPTLTSWASSSMIMNILKDPEIPVRPDNPLYLWGAAIRNSLITLFALLILVAYISINRDTIKKEKDITDKLDAKSLGIIHYEKKYKSLSSRINDRKTSLMVTDVTASFGFVESYRKIVTKIISEAEKKNSKVILVTSVREHEGKSTTSANIALTLAQQGRQVVLIDGDLRSPSVNEIFDIEPAANKSINAVLNHKNSLASALYTEPRSGLYLLLNDQGYGNSTEMISSLEMKKLVKICKEAADFVIIDSPPVSVLADAVAEANIADMSVLVVQYNRVQAHDVNDTIDILNECRAELLGCILNGVRSIGGTTAGYGYGGYRYRYGYGNYGNYGKYGKYGRYGRYGKYGAYGHYAQDSGKEGEA